MRIKQGVVRLFQDSDGREVKELAGLLLIPMLVSVAVSISFFVIVSVIFMILVLVSLSRSKDTSFFKDAFCALLFLYFLMNLMSLTQTNFWPESLRGILKVFRQVFLCMAIAYVVDTREKFRKFYLWLFLTAAVMALDAFFQGWSGRDLFNARKMTAYFGDHGRLTGPFKHANDFSAYLAMTATLFLGMVLDGRRFFSTKKYLFYWGGFLLVLAALLGTYSRTGWFAFLIAVLLMALLRKSKAVLSVLLVLMVWGALFSPPLVKLRIQSIWDPKGGTVSERKVLWGSAIQMIRSAPLLGKGVNTYSRNEPFYQLKGAGKLDHQYAHNGYLQMAAEIGLLGLFSFLLAILYFLWGSFKAFLAGTEKEPYILSAGASLMLAAMVFLIHSVFDTGLQSILLVNLFWICVGLAWAARRLRGA